MSVFEVLMLICFGFSWPVNIHKSITSKSVQGKSLLFRYVVMSGYLFGAIHKYVYDLDFAIYLYLFNMSMVLIDIMLYYKYKKLSFE